MRARFSIALIVLTLVGCSSPTSVRSDVLHVRAVDSGLELANRSTRKVFFFAAERGTLALLSWTPCTDPSSCPNVAAGVTRVIGFDQVFGYSEDAAEAVVYHWHLVNDNGEFSPDSIRALVVALKR